MTEQEISVWEKRFENHLLHGVEDEDVKKIYVRWWKAHDATYFSLNFWERSRALNRAVIPILVSGKSDEEIIKELDKLLPPGTTYM